MDKDRINKLKECLEKLETDYQIQYDVDGLPEDVREWPDEVDIDEISICFPDDYDSEGYNVDELFFYIAELDSLKEIDKTTSRTKHIRQTIIDSKYKDWETFRDKLCRYSFKNDNYTVRVVRNPFLIGATNSKNGNYEEKFGIGCSNPYLALELKYDDDNLLTDKEENELLEQITFYLTRVQGTAIYISEVVDVYNVQDDYYDGDNEEEDDDEEEFIVKVSDLIGYGPILRLYRQAKMSEDKEIKFLQFYKIIEYISPLVAKLNAYDKLNKRLDLLASSSRDHQYLDSIFEVTRKYDMDVKDDYLAESVVKNCVDVIPLQEFIPKRIRKNKMSNKPIMQESDMKDEQLSSLQKLIARIIYATRNSIVHAKSNYESNGYEMEGDELDDGNVMMEKIALSIIQWNERQPDNCKMH